jgi:hypothetical protein
MQHNQEVIKDWMFWFTKFNAILNFLLQIESQIESMQIESMQIESMQIESMQIESMQIESMGSESID